MGAKRYEMRSPEDRARRRAATAAMLKCRCGNVAQRGKPWCGRHDPEGDPWERDELSGIQLRLAKLEDAVFREPEGDDES